MKITPHPVRAWHRHPDTSTLTLQLDCGRRVSWHLGRSLVPSWYPCRHEVGR